MRYQLHVVYKQVLYEVTLGIGLGTQVVGPRLVRRISDCLANFGFVTVGGGFCINFVPVVCLTIFPEQGCLVGDLEGFLTDQWFRSQRHIQFELLVTSNGINKIDTSSGELDDQVARLVQGHIEHLWTHLLPPIIGTGKTGLDSIQIRNVEHRWIYIINDVALSDVNLFACTHGELVVHDDLVTRCSRVISGGRLVEVRFVFESFFVFNCGLQLMIQVVAGVIGMRHGSAIGGPVSGHIRVTGINLCHASHRNYLSFEFDGSYQRVIHTDIDIYGLAIYEVLSHVLCIFEGSCLSRFGTTCRCFGRLRQRKAFSGDEVSFLALPFSPFRQCIAQDHV